MITLDRSIVERLVRDALVKAQGLPSLGFRNKLIVNVSARHAHVTQEDLERLFGKGHQLTPFKRLYQDGFFAAEETALGSFGKSAAVHFEHVLSRQQGIDYSLESSSNAGGRHFRLWNEMPWS